MRITGLRRPADDLKTFYFDHDLSLHSYPTFFGWQNSVS
jgi:hypothetical protein